MTSRALSILMLAVQLLILTCATADAVSLSRASGSNRQSSVASPSERESRLRDILSRSEFKDSKSGWQDDLMARIQRMLNRWHGFGSMGDGETAGALLALITYAAIIGILVVIGYCISLIFRRIRMSAEPATLISDVYAGPDSPKLALAEAAKLAESGDYRSALRLVYLAALLRLDEIKLIRFDRTGTNWEYLLSLRNQPSLYGMLRPVTITFDLKWYGHEAATESDYRAFIETYTQLASFEVEK